MQRVIILIALLASLGAVAVVAWNQARGVRVTVTNRGPVPLSNVVVHVTGNQHRIGILAVGESRTVRVWPTSESHVEVGFMDQNGHPSRLNAGGYFEPNLYRGTINIELEDGVIKRNDCHIELSWL